MSLLARIVELVVTGRKLSAARPFVLSAITGLAIVITLGVFATVLAALMVCALIWLGYAQMLNAGAPIAAAAGVVALFTLVVLAVTVFIALRIWRDVRLDIEEALRPPLSPVTDTANAFIDGLLKPSPKARQV